MKQRGYRIPKEQLACRFGNHWYEDVAGDGGSRMPMFECTYDGDKQASETCEENSDCQCFEPLPTTICPKHDIEYLSSEWCELCHPHAEY